jgi:transcriptional regulator with XRE-family HTH domain
MDAMQRRVELSEFLRARRAALSPADVGLPAGRHRRTPGLRREELAMLAGVSVTWYTWLEQGRPINVSRDVLDALARTMRLDAAERDHLLALAAVPDAAALPGVEADAPDALTRLLAAMEPAPAYVLGPRWEFLAWNRAQARLYPAIERLDGIERNLVWVVMADPSTRDLLVDWEDQAHRIVAEFRAGIAGLQGDAHADELVRRLLAASAEFAEWWPAHDVARYQTRLRAYEHPRAGRLVFEYQQLTPSEWPSLRVVCQLPVTGDDSAERLAAWHEIA